MARTLARLVRAPTRLEWWEYGKLLGAAGLLVLAVLLLLGVPVPALVVGLVLHVALDFPLQSESTSARKGGRGVALTVHSLVAGGLPGIVVGLYTSPEVALVGLVVGFVSHYAIDYSRKYGIRDWRLAAIADQLSHVAVLLLLAA